MGFFNNLRLLIKRELAGGGASVPRLGGSLFVDNTPMAIATVYRCVRLLSDSVASLPVEHQRLRGGVFVSDNTADLHRVLNVQPSPGINAYDFRRQIVIELLLEGNAYIVPDYDSDFRLRSLTLCSRGTVTHNTETDVYTVNDMHNGIRREFRDSEIIHIKGATLANPKVGVSVLTFARNTIEIAATGDAETKRRFANSGRVRGILTNDTSVRGFGEYQDEELSKAAVSIDNRFDNGEYIVGIPGQAEFKQITLSSADMQFLESRKFTVREICRFFGVHPSFVFDDTSNNYKSVEQANADLLNRTLNPLLINIETELNLKLVAPMLCTRERYKFDRHGLFACDLDSLTRYRNGMLQAGATVNEVRRINNLPPIAGGDAPLVSANLRPLSENQSTNPQENAQ